LSLVHATALPSLVAGVYRRRTSGCCCCCLPLVARLPYTPATGGAVARPVL